MSVEEDLEQRRWDALFIRVQAKLDVICDPFDRIFTSPALAPSSAMATSSAPKPLKPLATTTSFPYLNSARAAEAGQVVGYPFPHDEVITNTAIPAESDPNSGFLTINSTSSGHRLRRRQRLLRLRRHPRPRVILRSPSMASFQSSVAHATAQAPASTAASTPTHNATSTSCVNRDRVTTSPTVVPDVSRSLPPWFGDMKLGDINGAATINHSTKCLVDHARSSRFDVYRGCFDLAGRERPCWLNATGEKNPLDCLVGAGHKHAGGSIESTPARRSTEGLGYSKGGVVRDMNGLLAHLEGPLPQKFPVSELSDLVPDDSPDIICCCAVGNPLVFSIDEVLASASPLGSISIGPFSIFVAVSGTVARYLSARTWDPGVDVVHSVPWLETGGVAVLGLHVSSDRSAEVPRGQQWLGLARTLGVAVLYGFTLPLSEIACKCAAGGDCRLDMQLVMCRGDLGFNYGPAGRALGFDGLWNPELVMKLVRVVGPLLQLTMHVSVVRISGKTAVKAGLMRRVLRGAVPNDFLVIRFVFCNLDRNVYDHVGLVWIMVRVYSDHATASTLRPRYCDRGRLGGILGYGIADIEDGDACDCNSAGFLAAVEVAAALPPGSANVCFQITVLCPIVLLETTSDLLWHDARVLVPSLAVMAGTSCPGASWRVNLTRVQGETYASFAGILALMFLASFTVRSMGSRTGDPGVDAVHGVSWPRLIDCLSVHQCLGKSFVNAFVSVTLLPRVTVLTVLLHEFETLFFGRHVLVSVVFHGKRGLVSIIELGNRGAATRVVNHQLEGKLNLEGWVMSVPASRLASGAHSSGSCLQKESKAAAQGREQNRYSWTRLPPRFIFSQSPAVHAASSQFLASPSLHSLLFQLYQMVYRYLVI